MAVTARFDPKPAGDVDTFSVDFSAVLAAGETITGQSATLTPGNTITVMSVTLSGTVVTAWLSGGSTGTDYQIDFTANTSFARTLTESAKVYCGPRS